MGADESPHRCHQRSVDKIRTLLFCINNIYKRLKTIRMVKKSFEKDFNRAVSKYADHHMFLKWSTFLSIPTKLIAMFFQKSRVKKGIFSYFKPRLSLVKEEKPEKN